MQWSSLSSLEDADVTNFPRPFFSSQSLYLLALSHWTAPQTFQSPLSQLFIIKTSFLQIAITSLCSVIIIKLPSTQCCQTFLQVPTIKPNTQWRKCNQCDSFCVIIKLALFAKIAFKFPPHSTQGDMICVHPLCSITSSAFADCSSFWQLWCVN